MAERIETSLDESAGYIEEEEIHEVHEGGSQSDNAEEVQGEEEQNNEEKPETEESTSKKLLRMQLSTATLQKLLKEGKMEKLPTGSFRISADALKELKQDGDDNMITEERPAPDARKRKLTAENSDSDDTKQHKALKTTNATPKTCTRNGSESETDVPQIKLEERMKDSNDESKSEKKSVKKRIQSYHDYLSDFNSSEDEDEEIVNNLKDSIAELAPRRRGHTSKPVGLLFEQLHKSLFGKVSEESDDDIDDILLEDEATNKIPLKEPDFNEMDKPNTIPDDFCLVGRIGNDGKTKMCIRSTGKAKQLDGKQYPVYNIDTGVGSVTTVTPLTVTALRSASKGMTKNRDETFMTDPDMVESLQLKTVALRKYKEQLKVLRRRYLSLAQMVASKPQLQTIGDLVAASAKFFTQDQLLFFSMQLKSGCDSTQGARFSTREKLLALGIYQQDPQTYKWLHNIFNLPPMNVLERWLDTIARGNPQRVKQLMYYVYTRYCFKPREEILVPQLPTETAIVS